MTAVTHTLDAEDIHPIEGCWVSVSEAATALGVSPTTVRRRIADGRLAARREPYRQAFRWLVRLPTAGAVDTAETDGAIVTELVTDRLTVAVARETDDEIRAIAARIDLTRHAVVEVLERERTVALRQAARLEQLASEFTSNAVAPPPPPGSPRSRLDDRGETEGSRWALLISVLACLGAVAAITFLTLPASSNGIVGAVAVVAGLVAIVECFLLVSAWAATISAKRSRRA